MSKLYSISLLLLPILLFASPVKKKKSYVAGYVVMTDGSKKEGFVKFFNFDTKVVSFTTDLESKEAEKLAVEDLKEIGLQMGDEMAVLKKDRAATYNDFGKFKGYIGDVWMEEIHDASGIKGYRMIVYESGGHTGFDALGNPTFAHGKFLTTIFGYRTESMEDVVFFPMETWWDRSDIPKAFDKSFRFYLNRVFKESCPKFAATAKKSEHKLIDFEKVLDAVSESCF